MQYRQAVDCGRALRPLENDQLRCGSAARRAHGGLHFRRICASLLWAVNAPARSDFRDALRCASASHSHGASLQKEVKGRSVRHRGLHPVNSDQDAGQRLGRSIRRGGTCFGNSWSLLQLRRVWLCRSPIRPPLRSATALLREATALPKCCRLIPYDMSMGGTTTAGMKKVGRVQAGIGVTTLGASAWAGAAPTVGIVGATPCTTPTMLSTTADTVRLITDIVHLIMDTVRPTMGIVLQMEGIVQHITEIERDTAAATAEGNSNRFVGSDHRVGADRSPGLFRL